MTFIRKFETKVSSMTLQQRQAYLIEQISGVKDENILILLEEELSHYTEQDVAGLLSDKDLNELMTLAEEPADKNVAAEDEYLKATGKWRSR